MRLRDVMGILGFLVVAVVVLAGGMWPLLPYVFPPLILVAIRRRIMPGFLSPVRIVVAIIWLLGVAGWIAYPFLQGAQGGGLQIVIDPKLADQTAVLIGVSVTFISIGAAMGVVFRSNLTQVAGLKPIDVPGKYLTWLLVGSLVPIGMILPEMPIAYLFDRPSYQMALDVPAISVFGHQLAVAAVAILGFLFAKQRGTARVFVFLAGLAYFSIFLAYGSRRLALVPILFALGAYAASMSRKSGYWVIVAGVLSALMLPIPLYVRGLPTHGLQPYLAAVPDMLQNGPTWQLTLNNIMVFFPITAMTAYGIPSIPHENILLELNPLPGELVGWYDVASTMGLNRATPYSGLGELGNAGWSWVAIVWIVVGILLTILERAAYVSVKNEQQVFAVAIVGLAGLFAITVTQYNFRNAQRDLIYAVLVALIVWLLPKRKSGPTTEVESPLPPIERSRTR